MKKNRAQVSISILFDPVLRSLDPGFFSLSIYPSSSTRSQPSAWTSPVNDRSSFRRQPTHAREEREES